MASRVKSLLLSNLKGGLNRFQSDAGRNQYLDGYDVVNDGGDLRRRDAFRSIGAGAPHMYPEGGVEVITSTDPAGLAGFDIHANRNPNFAALTGGALMTHLYVGNVAHAAVREKFSGIDIRRVTAGVAPVQHYVLVPEYWDGEVWVRLPAWVDETRDLVSGYFVPLARDGRISWHLDRFAADWALSTINGVGAFWIRLVIRTLADDVAGEYRGTGIPTGSGHSIGSPGIRVFALAPVNGLFSVRVANRAALICGGDRSVRMTSGATAVLAPPGSDASLLDRGAQLGCKSEDALETAVLHLLEDEGPAVFGVQNWPRPARAGVPIGTPNLQFGTAGMLKKTREQVPDGASGTMIDYEWRDQQHRGGLLARDVEDVVSDVEALAAIIPSLRAEQGYNHVKIRCTTAGGFGPLLGEEVSVWAHQYAVGLHIFYVYPLWSVAPEAGDRFEIYAPHSRLLVEGQAGNYEVQRNQEHTLELGNGAAVTGGAGSQPYSENPASISPTNPLYFKLGRELRWIADAGDAWSGAIDPVTGNFICTNGRTPLLEFDGRSLRRLRADFESAVAKAISGEAPDSGGPDSLARAIAKSQLRQDVPQGRFVAFHRTRLFVAGGADPLAIRWSEAGAANNIWPLINEDIVRDAQSDPIRGMISFNERLIIWTATAIHEAVDISVAPYFSFQQVARTFGFVGPDAACIVSGRDGTTELVGIAPDGIISYASGEPRIIVDRWDRYIAGGVNGDGLHVASAVFAPQASAAYFALPPRGSSKCTRLLRWDVLRNAFDVWRLSFGVRSMTVDTDELGRERLLIGTDTGLIMTLGPGNTDDGETIDAYALSPFASSPDGAEVVIQGAAITAKTIGAGAAQQMTFNLHTDGNARTPLQDGLLSCDVGAPNLGTDAATLGSVVPRAKEFPTLELNAISEAKGHSFAFRVGGACKWVFRSVVLRVARGASRGRGL